MVHAVCMQVRGQDKTSCRACSLQANQFSKQVKGGSSAFPYQADPDGLCTHLAPHQLLPLLHERSILVQRRAVHATKLGKRLTPLHQQPAQLLFRKGRHPSMPILPFTTYAAATYLWESEAHLGAAPAVLLEGLSGQGACAQMLVHQLLVGGPPASTADHLTGLRPTGHRPNYAAGQPTSQQASRPLRISTNLCTDPGPGCAWPGPQPSGPGQHAVPRCAPVRALPQQLWREGG